MGIANLNWQVFGHENVKQILNRQFTSGKFPNTYLFVGNEGIGKKTLALEFAKKILVTENLNNHPDFLILDEIGELGIESAINFISKLNFRPFIAQKKVAIINNAENLNINSSNALLKTLEEPSESTILILISSKLRLLPTIVSRCQVIKFHTFSSIALKKFAELNKLNIPTSAFDLSFGKINQLIKFSEDKNALIQAGLLAQKYKDLIRQSTGEKLLSIGEYAELETEDLEKTFLFWLSLQVRDLGENPTDYKKMEALNDSILGLKLNKNKKLILQNLFLKI